MTWQINRKLKMMQLEQWKLTHWNSLLTASVETLSGTSDGGYCLFLSTAHKIEIEISTYNNATLLYRLLAPSTLLGLHEFCRVHLVFTVETVFRQRLWWSKNYFCTHEWSDGVMAVLWSWRTHSRTHGYSYFETVPVDNIWSRRKDLDERFCHKLF